MKEEQIEAAFHKAALELTPFFHMTAEETCKVLMTLVGLDMLGMTFVGFVGGLCRAEPQLGEQLQICYEFGSSMTTSEPPLSGNTTPLNWLLERCRGLAGSGWDECMRTAQARGAFSSDPPTGEESA